MNQIFNNDENNIYLSEEILGKYLYYNTETTESYLHYIFTIKKIETNDNSINIIYHTSRCFLFIVPKNENSKAFVYVDLQKITIKPTDILYEMSFSEYVNTFREFVKNEGKPAKELPLKIIQDV